MRAVGLKVLKDGSAREDCTADKEEAAVYRDRLDSAYGSWICVVPVNKGLPLPSLMELAMAMAG